MISWTVPTTAAVLTGLTSQTSSIRQSNIFAVSQTSESYNSDFNSSTNHQSAGLSWTSHGVNGSSTYESWSSSNSYSFYENIRLTSVSYDEEGNSGESPTTISTSSTSSSESSFSASSTAGIDPVDSATSTTASRAYTFASVFQTTANWPGWTTSSATNGSVGFFTAEKTTSIFSTRTDSASSTYKTVTVDGTIAGGNVAATVVEAEAGEVLFYFSPPDLWQKSAATNLAQSDTRFTIVPSIATSQLMAVTEVDEASVVLTDVTSSKTLAGNSSSSWSISESVYSFTYKASTTTTAQQTNVSRGSLPNQTQATSTTAVTTTERNVQSFVWTSSSGSHDGLSSTYAKSFCTTTHAAQHGKFWHGSISWDAIRTVEFSTTFTGVSSVAVNRRSAYNNSYSVVRTYSNDGPDLPTFVPSLTSTSASLNGESSGRTVQQNTTRALRPVCGTAIGGEASQIKFVPTGVELGASRGGWFTIGAATTLTNYSRVNAGAAARRFSTIMPSTYSGTTYNAQSVTFTKESGTDTTTSSTLIGISGASSTAEVNGIFGIWGGKPASQETFANICVGGVYRNQIDGFTSSFEAGATTFTDTQSVSKMEVVTAIYPPLGNGESTRKTIYWTVARNSTALPPAMPPNA